MSSSGKKSALGLNVESELNVSSGLRINPQVQTYQGVFTPATPYATFTGSTYTPGTIVSNTVLAGITAALPNFYNMAGTTICMTVYRNLLKIGRPIDSRPNNQRINCPGLGNSRPDTFRTSYAGYGTFVPGKIGDAFYNEVDTTTVGLTEAIYPPYKYPADPTSSYMYYNWSSLLPSPGAPNDCTNSSYTPWTQDYQYKHEYAWLIGWPGELSWQSKQIFVPAVNPQEAHYPVDDNDGFAAAYFPRPDLAATQPWRARDANKIEYDDYFKFGFVGTIARQAYYEFWSTKNTRRKNQYLEFIRFFQQTYAYKENTNKKIVSFENSKTFLKGNFSNINDLTTNDIAGVSLSFRIFGNDLIRSGLSLDLSGIDKFGLPSMLLLNLQKNNALTDAVKMSLLLVDLNTEEISNILLPTYTPTPAQEKKIYESFKLIKGADLNDIKVILNILTPNLDSLADLLNLKKLFPNSWKTLTVPEYSVTASTAKIYDFIYSGDNVNTRIRNWGDYLENILPNDLAKANGAFMCAMNQIKNIKQMNIISFSQVVTNLEVTNKGLPLINGASGVPMNLQAANQGLALFALGTGTYGTFKMSDFFGAMSGQPYNEIYEKTFPILSRLATDNLRNVYNKLFQKSVGNNWALISRGKGHADASINTTGIPSTYTYNIFKTSGQASVGATTIGISGGNLTQYGIFSPTVRSGSDPTTYSTGQLVTFNPFDSVASPPLSHIYVVTGVSANSITFESILEPIPNPAFPANPLAPPLIPPYTGWPGLSTTVVVNERVYVYEKEYDGYPGNGLLQGTVQNLIDAANLEILQIQSQNQNTVADLNYWWDRLGTQMWKEQRAIPLAMPRVTSVFQGSDRADIDAFIRAIDQYATETQDGEAAAVLEAISDLTNLGGQSLVALLRETRNAKRLELCGGSLDNDIPDRVNPNQASANAIVEDGELTGVEITYAGNNYCEVPPTVTVYPQGGVFGGRGTGASLSAEVDENCNVDAINIDNPGTGYDDPPPIIIDPPPEDNLPPGSSDPLNPGNNQNPGSGITNPVIVPEELRPDPDASYNTDQAIEEVTICNCECWVN